MLQSDAIDLRAALIPINLNFIACRDIGRYDASLDNNPHFRLTGYRNTVHPGHGYDACLELVLGIRSPDSD